MRKSSRKNVVSIRQICGNVFALSAGIRGPIPGRPDCQKSLAEFAARRPRIRFDPFFAAACTSRKILCAERVCFRAAMHENARVGAKPIHQKGIALLMNAAPPKRVAFLFQAGAERFCAFYGPQALLRLCFCPYLIDCVDKICAGIKLQLCRNSATLTRVCPK